MESLRILHVSNKPKKEKGAKPMIVHTGKPTEHDELIRVLKDISSTLKPEALVKQEIPNNVVANSGADERGAVKPFDVYPDHEENKVEANATKLKEGKNPDAKIDTFQDMVSINTGMGGFLTASYANQKHNLELYLKGLKKIPAVSIGPKDLQGPDTFKTVEDMKKSDPKYISGKAPFSSSSMRHALGIA